MLATSGQAALTDNLEGYWTFDSDGSDSSANSRDFTMYGSPSFVSGLIGNAVNLDGTDDHGRRNVDDEAFDFGSGDFTIQAWVNFPKTDYQLNMKILEKASNDGAPSEGGYDFYAHRTAGTGFSYRSNEVQNINNYALNISGEVGGGG